MSKISHLCAVALFIWAPSDVAVAADSLSWPSTLPVYDHVVIVVEENKDFEQIFAGNSDAPYIKRLAAEGACIARMFGEEHNSQGNYFWLFSGSNQNVADLFRRGRPFLRVPARIAVREAEVRWIDSHAVEQGELVAFAALALMDGETVGSQQDLMQLDLIVRESCGANLRKARNRAK